jgi:O-antigen/teichoic acid export membrane protein
MAEGEKQDILSTLAKGAGITAVGMFFSKAISYFYRASVARLVGPEAYGNISIGLMIVSIGSTFSLLSLNSAIKNFVPKYMERDEQNHIRGIISSSFQISVPFSLIIGASVFISSELIATKIFGNISLIPVIQVFSLAIPLTTVTDLSLATTKAFKTTKYVAGIRQIGQNLIQLIASLALIGLGLELMGAVYGWLAGALFGSIASFYVLEKKFGPFIFTRKDSEPQHRKIFNYSYPLVLAGAIGLFLGWTDTFFLGYYLPEAKVGLYNAALPTAMLMLLPYQAIQSLVMPSMSEVEERNDKKLGELLKTISRWTVTLTLPGFCLMFLFSPEILHLLFGQNYITASTTLTVLSLGYFLSASVGHQNAVLKATDRTKVIHKNAVFNFLINVGLNIVLIPRYGIIGAAVATTISIILGETLLLAELYHFEKITPFNIETIKPVFASLISLAITWTGIEYLFTTVPLWALIPGLIVFGTAYLSILYSIGGFREEEINFIEAMLRKNLRRLSDILNL